MPSGHECRQCVAPVQTSVAPVQRKNKYSCLVKRIRANGLKHQTLPLMGAFYVIDQIFGKFFLLKDLLDTDVSIQLLS